MLRHTEHAAPSSRGSRVAGIVREGLPKIRKHSGAQNVEVHLTAADDKYQVVVQDDGRGFNFSGRVPQQQLENTDNGPRVIQETVSSILGEPAIEPYPNRGLQLEVRYDARM
jgi:signal transduction histidine kinase